MTDMFDFSLQREVKCYCGRYIPEILTDSDTKVTLWEEKDSNTNEYIPRSSTCLFCRLERIEKHLRDLDNKTPKFVDA